MKKNVIFSILMSTVLFCNLSAEDIIFQDIQQKLDKKKINDVELTKVLETPSLFKNSTIRFEAKFAQIGNLSRVFHTKFDLSEYLNLAVWPDEVKLWQKDGLKVFLPLVFVKKSSSNATIIGKLKKYQRIQITGLVTNDYQNQPWIEVLAIKVLDKNALSEEALYHIRLGDKYHYGDHPSEVGAEKPTQSNVGVNFSYAEIEYQKALTYDLSDVEKSAVLELLGEVQLKQGKVDAAISSLTATLNINPKSGRSNHLMAMAQLKAEHLDQAKIFGEKAIDSLSKDKNVLLCNAEILIKLKSYEMAKVHCINANRLDADDIRPYAFLGEIYDALNEYDVSKEMYRRAINLKEGVDNFDLHKNMGHALLKIALVEKNAKEKENALMQADREFNATINQINDKNAEAFYLWGRVLEEWKSRPKSEIDSIEKFDKAIALEPDYFNAHMHKASVLNHRLSKPKEAIASYEKASSIRPNDLNPLKALDKIYREAKNYEKTVSVNTRIVAIEPKNFGAVYALGMDNHMYLNQQGLAVDWFTKAFAIDMNHTEVEFYLGKALYLNGKKSESIKPLLNAAVKLPGEKLVTYYLAKAYSETDQSAKAIEMLVKYNGLDSSNVETRVLLSKEYLNNPKTVDTAIKTAGEAVELADKQKVLQGASYDAHGWALVAGNQSQKALVLLEKANKEQVTNERQYHLASAYVQLNMFAEAEVVIKKLESIELDKKLASDVKRLRADLESRKKSDLELKQKTSTDSAVKVSQPEKKKEPEKAKEPEKKKEPVKVAEPEKKKSDSDAAAKEAAKEAEKTQKLEEKKRVDREKAKLAENERLAKIEKEKEKEREAAAKEEAEKKRKQDVVKAKADEKLAAQKAEEEAKKKKADEKASKENASKSAEAKKAEDKKAKELAKEKEAQDKKAKEAAKANEEAKANADKAKKEQTKAEQEKLAKDKADQEKKAKADAKANEEAKTNAEKAKKEQAKAEQEKVAKAKADQEKKAKEDAKAKAEQEKAAKVAQDKMAKENAEKQKQQKELAEKKAKDEENAKAEAAKQAKAAAEQAKKDEEAKNKAALLKQKEDAKKAEADKKKKADEEKKKAEELEKQKEAERAASLKLSEEKKKQAEKASQDRAKANEEAEKIEKQRKKEAEKSNK